MDAYIKLKGIDQPCRVPSITRVDCVNDLNTVNTITNFEVFSFSASLYYVFVGESILHVGGQNIEYVLFKK